MTSTDSSASNYNNQDQNNSTNDTNVRLDTSSKTMPNDTPNESVNLDNSSPQPSDTSSSSPTSESPACSASPTSTNDTSTDKTQTTDKQPTKSPKDQTNKSTNNQQRANTYSKSTNKSTSNHSSNTTNSSIENSPANSGQHQYINYYPAYVPRQAQTGSAQGQPPYTQLEGNPPQPWPQAMAAAAAMAAMGDPMQMAAYMNNGVQGGPPSGYQSGNEINQQHYDQFSFGFTPAFGFGYNGNGSIDYAALQAAQQGSNLNPQSNQWTPAAAAAGTVSGAGQQATVANNPTSSPANTTTSSNDTTSSVPSTTASETSVTNSKWMQVIQDPLAVHEFNTFQQQQQVSPVDMYNHQPHYNYRSHHHYSRHQHAMQSNYNHHYQYNNIYPVPHYQSQYSGMQQFNYHHYGHGNSKYNKYNNNYNNNNNNHANNASNSGDSNMFQTHDNNNNSNKSNNLNNTESVKLEDDTEIGEQSEEAKAESKSESGSKSWASIVGVPNAANTKTTKNTTTKSVTPPQTQEVPEQRNGTSVPQKHQQMMTNNFNEYSENNYTKPKYYKNKYNNSNQNTHSQETSQEVFDLTNRSFPPIGADAASINAEPNEKQPSKKSDNSSNPDTTYTTNAQHFLNSKKQQQYNNYQRQQQQQFNLPVGKYQNYQNGYSYNNSKPNFTNGMDSSMQSRGEKTYKNDKGGDMYHKRHQPQQHTLSSFLNILDKTKFDVSKSKSANSGQTNSNGRSPTDYTTPQATDNAEEHLVQQTESLHIDPSQLVVYTNPTAYNPKEFNTSPKAARFFVIKSYSEDDIHRSIKYNIWCSTEHGNRRLDSAYFKGDGQVPVYLFFSVNGSGHFCGMAEMQSRVDYNKKTGVWSQDKWRGCFQVKWVYVKDVPNSLLRAIKLENNDNKPVTNSRDTQEIPYDKGRQVLKVFHTYNHSSSILDDFEHYERKQEESKVILKIAHNTYEQAANNNNNNPGMNFVEKPNYSVNNQTEQVENSIQVKAETGKEDTQSLQNSSQATTTSVTSSPSTSSSSSTSSIEESKQQQSKVLDQPQNALLISSSS